MGSSVPSLAVEALKGLAVTLQCGSFWMKTNATRVNLPIPAHLLASQSNVLNVNS